MADERQNGGISKLIIGVQKIPDHVGLVQSKAAVIPGDLLPNKRLRQNIVVLDREVK